MDNAKPLENGKRLWIAMVILGACARLLPHPWNFSPVVAIALFAGVHARQARTGVLAMLGVLTLSDAVLGFHSGFWYVYAAALIPVALGRWCRGTQHGALLAGSAIASSLSFFVLTNFMVWAVGTMYPHTVTGLTAAYVAGIPFYQNQALGDAFYTLALFGGYRLLEHRLRPAPQAA
jgi:hypothetical protein